MWIEFSCQFSGGDIQGVDRYCVCATGESFSIRAKYDHSSVVFGTKESSDIVSGVYFIQVSTIIRAKCDSCAVLAQSHRWALVVAIIVVPSSYHRLGTTVLIGESSDTVSGWVVPNFIGIVSWAWCKDSTVLAKGKFYDDAIVAVECCNLGCAVFLIFLSGIRLAHAMIKSPLVVGPKSVDE